MPSNPFCFNLSQANDEFEPLEEWDASNEYGIYDYVIRNVFRKFEEI